jgi:hypothetical protein
MFMRRNRMRLAARKVVLKVKLQHWCGVSANFGLKTSPVLEFAQCKYIVTAPSIPAAT